MTKNNTFLKKSIFAAAMIFTSFTAWGQITETLSTAGAGTWTCPVGVTSITVECWGGGGAGGAAKHTASAGTGNSGRGGGAAGGGYSKINTIAVTPGTSYAYSVGAGGLGVLLTSDNEVAPSGDNTYFIDVTTVNAPGGNGGTGRICTGSAQTYGAGAAYTPTTTAVGDVKYNGGNGSTANGTIGTGQGGSSGGTASNGTNGSTTVRAASVVVGGGNGAAGRGAYGTGNSGGVPGGAGAGAKADGTTSDLLHQYKGGNGGNGQIKITYTTSNITISENTTYTGNVIVPSGATLTINSGVTLSLAAGAKLTNNGTITNNGTLEFLSDATNGTATLIGTGIIDVAGTTNVNQSLQHPSSALRTWYASSPFVANIAPTPALTTIKTFNETDNAWSATSLTEMEAKKGYLVVPADAANNLLFSSTGALNSGDLDITLTGRDGVGANQGFNLVGNPYPSYLDWKAIYDYTLDAGVTYPNRTALRSVTMWYRTKNGSAYGFETVNGEGVGSPTTASKYIPPMQGFWVRAAVAGSTLKLTNAMRSHAPAANKLLRAPALNNRTLLRLQVSNGVNTDETVLYLSENAQNGLDQLDAPKMYNSNMDIPQIYTTLANENYVINSINTLPLDAPIGIGFMAGNASSFTIKANEITNIPEGVKVILRDNVTLAETDLTDGTATYNFARETRSGDRFSLIFRSQGATTGVEKTIKSNATVYVNSDNRIVIAANEKSNFAIYNTVGMLIVNGVMNSKMETVNHFLKNGVYVVKVNNTIQKVIIK